MEFPSRFRGRRRFLGQTACAALLGSFPSVVRAGIGTAYAGIASDRYLGPVEVLAQVKDDEVFTEGPAADRSGSVYFTNVPASKILRWDPQQEELTVFRSQTNRANGLCFDRRGRLLACEGGGGRVTRTNLETGQQEILADGFGGRKLAAPNDLCLDARGRIYFTSRSAVVDPVGENKKAVYRIDPDGKIAQLLVWPAVHMPNGIVISPDDRTLYLIEAHPDAHHHRHIRAYDLREDGSLANARVVVDLYPGRSGDGMAIDAEGNLYVAAGLHAERATSETLETRPGIHVFSPQGRLLAFRETPEDTITNCTFGGPDLKSLYVACGTLLLRIRTEIPGKPISTEGA